MLVINGDQDMCQPPDRSRHVAELTGGELLVLKAPAISPTPATRSKVNLEIDRFVRRVAAAMPTGCRSRRYECCSPWRVDPT